MDVSIFWLLLIVKGKRVVKSGVKACKIESTLKRGSVIHRPQILHLSWEISIVHMISQSQNIVIELTVNGTNRI